MEFNVPKTHELFRQMIREFVEKEVKPIAAEVDENERFPMETVEKMAKIGIMGIPIPKQYGGAGGDNLMYAMAVEELLNQMPEQTLLDNKLWLFKILKQENGF